MTQKKRGQEEYHRTLLERFQQFSWERKIILVLLVLIFVTINMIFMLLVSTAPSSPSRHHPPEPHSSPMSLTKSITESVASVISHDSETKHDAVPKPRKPTLAEMITNASIDFDMRDYEEPRDVTYLFDVDGGGGGDRKRRKARNIRRKKTQLTQIVIPFFAGQLAQMLEDFELWDLYPPCFGESHSHVKDVDLMFFISRNVSMRAIRKAILHRVHESSWSKCFRSIDVVSAGLTAEEDTYWLGSRAHFEKFLQLKFLARPRNVGYVMYMEPDCFLFRANWLQLLRHEANDEREFIIKGHNSTERFRKVISHINGNAMYNLGDPRLSYFYFHLYSQFLFPDPYHSDGATKVYHHAYDMDISHFLNYHHDTPFIKDIFDKVISAEFLQNYFHMEYNLSETKNLYPEAFIAHGGHRMGEG